MKQELSRDAQRGTGAKKAQVGGSLKSQLRSQRRLLVKLLESEKDEQTKGSGRNVAATKQLIEQRIQALEQGIANKSRLEREKKNAQKFHALKFFERQKLTRIQKQLQRQWKQKEEDPNGACRKEIESDLEVVALHELYVAHFPNDVKYQPIFNKQNEVVVDVQLRRRVLMKLLSQWKRGKLQLKSWVYAKPLEDVVKRHGEEEAIATTGGAIFGQKTKAVEQSTTKIASARSGGDNSTKGDSKPWTATTIETDTTKHQAKKKRTSPETETPLPSQTINSKKRRKSEDLLLATKDDNDDDDENDAMDANNDSDTDESRQGDNVRTQKGQKGEDESDDDDEDDDDSDDEDDDDDDSDDDDDDGDDSDDDDDDGSHDDDDDDDHAHDKGNKNNDTNLKKEIRSKSEGLSEPNAVDDDNDDFFLQDNEDGNDLVDFEKRPQLEDYFRSEDDGRGDKSQGWKTQKYYQRPEQRNRWRRRRR